MPSPLTPTCWVLTEGHAGMQHQCIGLAEALGLAHSIKHIRPRAPWKYLPPNWWPRPLAMAAHETPLAPPWPDVLISCGRRSVAAARAIRRAAKGKTIAIHIQDPHVPPGDFDLLVVPEHDALRGEQVVVVRGALHHVTPGKLADAAPHFAPLVAALPHPLIAVLVGGSNRRQSFTAAIATGLAAMLAEAARQSGGAIALTPSRRTDAAITAALRDGLAHTAAYIWNGQGENPYFGFLALADMIVVTSDSVSMMSEACSTGKPVYIYEVPGGSGRLQRFRDKLFADGMARPFTGSIASWPVIPLDDTVEVARIIRTRFPQLASSEAGSARSAA
jgi:mitochondrial fission protein ELM1